MSKEVIERAREILDCARFDRYKTTGVISLTETEVDVLLEALAKRTVEPSENDPLRKLARDVDAACLDHLGVGLSGLSDAVRFPVGGEAIRDRCSIRAADLLAAMQNAAPSTVSEEWQPIETAPKDGDDILVMGSEDFGGRTCLVVSWDDEPPMLTHHWATLDGLHYHDAAFEYWRPLPAPPQSAAPKEERA